MLLKVKNKMLMMMDKTLAKAESIGAIPECIELDKTEAETFLKEIVSLSQNDVINNIKFKGHDDRPLAAVIRWLDEKDMATYWKSGECSFWYKDVQLKIVEKDKDE